MASRYDYTPRVYSDSPRAFADMMGYSITDVRGEAVRVTDAQGQDVAIARHPEQTSALALVLLDEPG